MPNIPNVKWAQRSDKVYLTIEVAGCEGPKVRFLSLFRLYIQAFLGSLISD